ncbi:MAG: hypothetical protein MUC97_16755 [Bernardetiaceae bacterium]|jgi:hypothetical protein|nr:hypothetical protein [Bernardetiaceae bacterium]
MADLPKPILPPDREIFKYENPAPAYHLFVPGVLTAMAFLGLALVFAANYSRFGFIGFLLAAVLTGLPVALQYFKTQVRSLHLSPDELVISRGHRGQERATIALSNINRIEVTESQPPAGQPRERVTTLLASQRPQYGRSAVCVLHTVGGQKIELPAKYFTGDRFAEFVHLMQTTVRERQAALAQNPYQQVVTHSPAELRILEAAKTNYQYLQEDRLLKAELESNLAEAYKTLYHHYAATQSAPEHNAEPIFSFEEEGVKRFVLKNDFLSDLDPETKEIGLNLIQAGETNLAVVNTRINYYEKIDRELDKLRTKEHQRRKLQDVAEKLKGLQEKNTNKSIEQNVSQELNQQATWLAELEALTQQVAGLNDLEQSLVLREHISLFDTQVLPGASPTD